MNKLLLSSIFLFVLSPTLKAENFYRFDEFKPQNDEACIDCEKMVGLAQDVHSAVGKMVEQKKINSADLSDAANKLQGIIVIVKDSAEAQKNKEDCPSLPNYAQVMPPTRDLSTSELLISKEVPLYQLNSFGINNREGERFYLKGTEGNKEALIEVTILKGYKARMRYFAYPHDQLLEMNPLPTLGTLPINQEKEPPFWENLKTERGLLGGQIETKGEIVLKEGKAKGQVTANEWGSSGKVEVDKKGTTSLSLSQEDDYYAVNFNQVYDKTEKEKTTFSVSTPLTNSGVTLKQYGESTNEVQVKQKVNLSDYSVAITADFKSEGENKTNKQQKAVSLDRKGERIISASIDYDNDFTVTIPASVYISEGNNIMLQGENIISSKSNRFDYAVMANDKEVVRYSFEDGKNSDFTKHTISRRVVASEKSGDLDIGIQRTSGASFDSNEQNGTVFWMTFKKKF